MNNYNREPLFCEGINHVYTVKFHYTKDDLRGILLKDTQEWSILQFIPIDYQVDGIVIINNSHIRRTNHNTEEIFIEKVLRAKEYVIPSVLPYDAHDKSIFDTLLKSKQLLQIDTYRNDITYVARLIAINEKSIKVEKISVEGTILSIDTIPFNKIWSIMLDNDYLYSLQKYISKYVV